MSRRDLAVDLGTANTLVYQQGRGIVFDEPTVVAADARSGRMLAVGREAWAVVGAGTAGAVPLRPLQRGAITDFEVTRQMVRLILRRLGVARFPRPRALVCVPSSLTSVERRAVEEAVALAAVVHPEWFQTEELPGDVETRGEITLGATIFDRRPNAPRQADLEVAVGVDASLVADYILRGLAEAGRQT